MRDIAKNVIINIGIMLLFVKFALLVVLALGFIHNLRRPEDTGIKLNRRTFREIGTREGVADPNVVQQLLIER